MKRFTILVVVVAVFLVLLARNWRDHGNTSILPCHDTDVLTPFEAVALSTGGKKLVLRQSGIHEKEFFLELYSAETTFDECQHASTEPLDALWVDRSLGRPKSIIVQDGKLTVIYDSRAPGSETPLTRIPVLVTGR